MNARKILATASAAVTLAGIGVVAAPAANAYVSDYETYTLVAGLKVHRSPSTSSWSDYSIPTKGASVDLKCWARGTSVNGDNVWYYGYWMGNQEEPPGYMAGYYLATGSDPNPNIRPC